jgi:hypothetical protein
MTRMRITAAALLLVTAGVGIACTQAQAEPLEATYYYLPG